MDRLIVAAEKIIESRAQPDVRAMYIREKNVIMFGSLADTINRYEIDNRDLSMKVNNLKRRQCESLDIHVKREMEKIITGFAPNALRESTFTGLSITLKAALDAFHAQTRLEITRFRENERKYEQKIDAGKTAESAPPVNPHPSPSEALVAKVAKTVKKLEVVKQQIHNVARENRELVERQKQVAQRITRCRSKVGSSAQSRSDMKARHEHMIITKATLQDELEKAEMRVMRTKLVQRFGTSATSPRAKPKIDELLSLRAEISKLTGIRERMVKEKKNSMISQVRSRQGSATIERLGLRADI